MSNTLARRALALLSIPLLAAPSAIGVYTWLAPEVGQLAAGSAAGGFEVLTIGVNILVLATPELRRYARRVSLGAVGSAVLFNTLAHYQARIGGPIEQAAFHPVALLLAFLSALPLAALVYGVSSLLHQLDHQRAAAPAYAYARPAAPPEAAIYVEPSNRVEGSRSNTSNTPAIADKTCKYCGAGGLTQAQLLAHGRARARRGVCGGIG